jgi:hypothetical protein
MRTGEAVEEDVTLALTPEVIRTAQRADDVISVIVDLMETSQEKPPWSLVEALDVDVQQLWAQWESLEILNEILCRNFVNADNLLKYRQLVVPHELRASLLLQLHAGNTAGHFGISKTQERVKRSAYWRGWMKDVALFCRRCDLCCRYRRWPTVRQGALQYTPATTTMQKMHVDLTGPHVRSKNGFKYLLTAVDYFTKYLVSVPIRDKTALSVAKALVQHVYLHLGCCEIQVSNQGR